MRLVSICFLLIFSVNSKAQSSLDNYMLSLDPALKISMLIQNKEGNILCEQNSAQKVPSASVIKVPILIAFFNEIENHNIGLKRKYTLKEGDKVAGAGDMQFEAYGIKFTYAEIAKKMISISDNIATNILIDKIGMQKINETIKTMDLDSTVLARKMMDFDAIKEGKQNFTSAKDANKVLLDLLNTRLLKIKNGKKAIEYLIGNEDYTTIRKKIPNYIPIAHKTGTLDYIRGDSGIIFSKDPVILTVFVENFESLEQAEEVISEIGKLAYQEYGGR